LAAAQSHGLSLTFSSFVGCTLLCPVNSFVFYLVFSTDVKLFAKQSETDEIIEDAAAMIGCPRSSLNGQLLVS
jgi:hypothetical protein